jgi:hypothetical protein
MADKAEVLVQRVVLAGNQPLNGPPVVQRNAAPESPRLPGVQYRLVFNETTFGRPLLHATC